MGIRPPAVLWLAGADAVGKSAVAWEVYTRLADDGHAVAHVDTDYLGFCSPPPEDLPGLVAANLTATWRTFAAAGADTLVVSGVVVDTEQRDRFAGAVPGGRLHLTLLTAGPDVQRHRLRTRRLLELRSRGQELGEQEAHELEEYARSSVRFAEHLGRQPDLADLVLDTDACSPAELARAVVEHWGGRDDRATAR